MRVGADAAALVVVGLVDVVAEAEDEVDVLLVGDRALGVVEAGLVVLAGVEGDPDRGLESWGGGAEAADRELEFAGDEAVEVLAAGLRGRGLVLAVWPRSRAGDDRPLSTDVVEVAVLGDEQAECARCALTLPRWVQRTIPRGRGNPAATPSLKSPSLAKGTARARARAA